MPKRYAYRRKRKRKKSYKKRYKRRRSLRRTYVPSGLSTTRIAKVRWSKQVNLISQSGILTSTHFLANGPYNPGQNTLVTDTPLSWSTWSQMYQKHCCLGSKIMIIPCQNDGTNSNATNQSYTGVYLSETNIPLYLQRDQFIMATNTRSRGQWRLMTLQRNQVPSMKSCYSTKKWWNLKDVKDADRFWINNDRVPAVSDLVYFVLWLQNADPAFENSNMQYQIIIDYIVLFAEPKNIPQ